MKKRLVILTFYSEGSSIAFTDSLSTFELYTLLAEAAQPITNPAANNKIHATTLNVILDIFSCFAAEAAAFLLTFFAKINTSSILMISNNYFMCNKKI